MSDGMLFVCATPIGNLGDASSRLRETLESVDVVFAEDTRRTAKLLAHFGISVSVRSLFAGNEKSRAAELVEEVRSGRKVALLSDAGMPNVSDPGAEAVRLVRGEGLGLVVIPGPSAVTSALGAAGWPADRFSFEGFLPRKGGDKQKRVESIAREDRPVVLFASPHRLVDDLSALASVLGSDRQITVNRELTKLHEEIWAGTLGEAVVHWGETDPRGEFTVVISPGTVGTVTLEGAVADASKLVESGVPVSQAARDVAEVSGLPRRAIYQALLERQELS